jgi:hypothetical protein
VILVGAMGTIYKDYTNLWQTFIWTTIRLKNDTNWMNTPSDMRLHS